jgi:glycosyltransferase involved in cell wall biosynthesis
VTPADAAPRPSLSVCVIACDEEETIGHCLRSADFADECVVVVDAKSRDATEEIARATGARVVVHPYEGNVEQKNHALALARGEWVLALDADEAVTPALRREIQDLLRAPPAGLEGAEVNRVTFHLGRWIRHGDFFPDWQLRLFRRGAGRWSGTNPHGRVRVDGGATRLRGELEHRSYRDLADQVERIQDFSTIQARANHTRGRRCAARDMWLRPPARFLRAYVLKQGFRDGVPGFVIAAATAFHVFLKYAKQWELEHAKPPERGSGGGSA